MKRKASLESIECVSSYDWTEDHVMQVFKVLIFYGFDNMTDISMFAISKKANSMV